jgi:hypothetical protein
VQNPNAYDEAAYLQATNEMASKFPKLLDDLFLAGADLENIQDVMTDGIDNCMTELAGRGLKVTIYEPD